MAKIKDIFGYKSMWFAVKGAEIDTILSCCPELKYEKDTDWKDAIFQIAENWTNKIMLSGPYDGWVFLIGNTLWDLSQTDEIVNMMNRIGAQAQEVCYFASHRVSDSYAFGRMVHGKLIRLYACGDGQLFGSIGERSDAEKKLSLTYAETEEDLFNEDFDLIDEEDILSIAEEWSIHPGMLYDREEARTVLADKSSRSDLK